jgi:hypothetical protein
MRRLFAIFLLVLLPLQFSWAAVAAYCGHESGTAAPHVGHHEHALDKHHEHTHEQWHGDSARADPAGAQAEQDPAAGFDYGCGHCHGSCASMPTSAGKMAPIALASHPMTPVEGVLRTLPQSPPERPQWRPLA